MSQAEINRKKIKLPFKTIGFVILCIIALAVTFVSSIMASTNFSFGEDPRYTKTIRIDLRPESKSEEKEIIRPEIDATGSILTIILENLPDNIIEGESIIKEVKIDGMKALENGDIYTGEKISDYIVDGKILLSIEKIYKVEYTAYIKYDIGNVAVRASLNGLALVLIVFGVILYTIDKKKKTDPEYAKQKTEIDTAHRFYRPLVWKKYQDPVNLSRKINAWKAHCYEKERVLDDKASEEDLRIYVKGTDEERKNNLYCQKKITIREMSSDKWIEDNIEYKYVKYDKISYRLVFIGDNPAIGAKESNEFITKHKAGLIVIENLPRLLIGVGLSLLGSLLVIDILSFNMTIIISALMSMANIAWNIYLSSTYGASFFESRSMWDITFRAGIANEYQSFLTTPSAVITEHQEISKEEEPHVKRNEEDRTDQV